VSPSKRSKLKSASQVTQRFGLSHPTQQQHKTFYSTLKSGFKTFYLQTITPSPALESNPYFKIVKTAVQKIPISRRKFLDPPLDEQLFDRNSAPERQTEPQQLRTIVQAVQNEEDAYFLQ
jgi:hypothetical protein